MTVWILWIIMVILLSLCLSVEWTGPSQHAVHWGPQHPLSERATRWRGPIHCKLTLTEFDWNPLPLAVSFPAARTAGVSSPPPPPPFIHSFRLTQPINAGFVPTLRAFCHSPARSSVRCVCLRPLPLLDHFLLQKNRMEMFVALRRVPFVSRLSLSLRYHKDEDVCCATASSRLF